jgi:hypothetical protein
MLPYVDWDRPGWGGQVHYSTTGSWLEAEPKDQDPDDWQRG